MVLRTHNVMKLWQKLRKLIKSYKISPYHGRNQPAHKPFHSLIRRNLNQRSPSKQNSKNISATVIYNHKRSRQYKPNDSIINIHKNSCALRNDQHTSHNSPSQHLKLVLILSFSQDIHKQNDSKHKHSKHKQILVLEYFLIKQYINRLAFDYFVTDKKRGKDQLCDSEKVPVYHIIVRKLCFSLFVSFKTYDFFEYADVYQ